jgi:arylsulfatase A-like enzyme
MQRLDALGALDNTLIYVTSDMGNPSLHSTQNVPTLLCGGAGGKIRMGRHIRLSQDCADGSPWCTPADMTFRGVSNNHLLISIAQAFGVQLASFGTQIDSKHDTGALGEL